MCSNRFCSVDVVCLAVVSARPVLAWVGVFPIAWERIEDGQHVPGACRWDSCILIHPDPSGGCVRIDFVRLMLFVLQLSAYDLFSLGWASLCELGRVSMLVNLSLVRADDIPVS